MSSYIGTITGQVDIVVNITGNSGAGKTTAAKALVDSLIERFGPERPVYVERFVGDERVDTITYSNPITESRKSAPPVVIAITESNTTHEETHDTTTPTETVDTVETRNPTISASTGPTDDGAEDRGDGS